MAKAPNTLNQMLDYCRVQHANPTQNWEGYCQMFTRSGWAIPPLFGSAWAQWLGADDEDKHPGTDPSKAPLGAALCFKGDSPFGHIMPGARPFKTGVDAAWSNDLVTVGKIDKVARTAPVTAWGQRYLGYLTAVNHYDLNLSTGKPAKPKDTKRYAGIDRAIQRLQGARTVARREHDEKDVALLGDEIRRLKRMHDRLRHS